MTWQAPCVTWHPHPPHDTSPGSRCQGLTQQEADLGRLVSLLTHVRAEHAPPLEMPPGVRLFCHPSVYDLLSREHGPGSADGSLAEVFSPWIPITQTADMPDGKWILVTDAAVPGRGMIRGEDAAREEEGRWAGFPCRAVRGPFRCPLNTRHPAPLDAVRAEIAARRGDGAPRVGVVGFSAGGHLAGHAALASAPGGPGRPDFALLGYAITSMETDTYKPAQDVLLGPGAPAGLRRRTSLDRLIHRGAPPFFIWHTAEDVHVPPEHSYRLATALAAYSVAHTLHVSNTDRTASDLP